ncbi:MAG: hypothetical protein M3446_08040 [Actinomycetota bacterium]|nr:hypothetical protein [Geodermatophilaceae bacterium]MDQ3505632.1 hypothetical protein [Actinomycetota bacterium]
MNRRRGVSLFTLIYLAIGVVVALTKGYNTFTSFSEVLSFVIAVILWPAVIFGADLRVNVGALS